MGPPSNLTSGQKEREDLEKMRISKDNPKFVLAPDEYKEKLKYNRLLKEMDPVEVDRESVINEN